MLICGDRNIHLGAQSFGESIKYLESTVIVIGVLQAPGEDKKEKHQQRNGF
jgi:hypothetical protein